MWKRVFDSCHKINIIGKLRAQSTQQYKKQLTKLLEPYTVEEIFDQKTSLSILRSRINPCERRFYLLPKVHKDRSKWAHNHLTPLGDL